jgi:hypothetical protein
MPGSEPAIERQKTRVSRHRAKLTLYLFMSLLTLSNIVVIFDVNNTEWLSLLSVWLWPPFLIAFAGALWLYFTASEKGDQIWVPIVLLSLGSAFLFLIVLKLIPYNDHSDWGTSQGFVPSVTLLSIAAIAISWKVFGPWKSSRHGRIRFIGLIGLLLFLTFVVASVAFFYLIEFIPLTVASAAIWGWVYDPLRQEQVTTRMRAFSGAIAFLTTFVIIPILVLVVPYYMFWFYFT